MERTLIIVKPDALQRNLLGEIIHRFERKGLKIVGLKMMAIDDLKVEEHYAHHIDKPFFANLKSFMQSAPVVAMALEGLETVNAVRLITGDTKGREADAGTIRGDFGYDSPLLSNSSKRSVHNLIHASGSVAEAKFERQLWFKEKEICQSKKEK